MSTTLAQEPTMVGAWTPFHKITPAEQEVFDIAMKNIIGVEYTPFSVSTQLVNGTNYRFKCTASIPPSDVIWEAMVHIYQPIGGTPTVTKITPIHIN